MGWNESKDRGDCEEGLGKKQLVGMTENTKDGPSGRVRM